MIRSTKIEAKTYFAVIDIFADAGIKCRGQETLSKYLPGTKIKTELAMMKCADGVSRKHLVTNSKGKSILQEKLKDQEKTTKQVKAKKEQIKQVELKLASVLRKDLRTMVDKAANVLNGGAIHNKSESSQHNAIYVMIYEKYKEETGVDLVELNRKDRQKNGGIKRSVLEFAQDKGYIVDLHRVAKKEIGSVAVL